MGSIQETIKTDTSTLAPSSLATGPSAIFTYSTEHLTASDKVRFFYGLNGRDGKPGILQRHRVERLGSCVLLSPLDGAALVEFFLKKWGCAYTRREVLLR